MALIEVNTEAPDFQTIDFKGNGVLLSDFRNEKNVLLVFNRSFL